MKKFWSQNISKHPKPLRKNFLSSTLNINQTTTFKIQLQHSSSSSSHHYNRNITDTISTTNCKDSSKIQKSSFGTLGQQSYYDNDGDDDIIEAVDDESPQILIQAKQKTILEYLPFRDPNDDSTKEINKIRTENNSATYDSTGNPLLDFFFEVLPDIEKDNLYQLFSDAWKQDDEKAMKLLFNLRDIRGGKSERQLFYELLVWLRYYHPETLYENLQLFPEFGYYKDLLYFITRDCEGELITQQNVDKEKARQQLKMENEIKRRQKKRNTSRHWFGLRYVRIFKNYCCVFLLLLFWCFSFSLYDGCFFGDVWSLFQ